jgi:hypothetical protein
VNPVLYFKTIFQLGLSHRQAKTSIGWAEPDMWEGSGNCGVYMKYKGKKLCYLPTYLALPNQYLFLPVGVKDQVEILF